MTLQVGFEGWPKACKWEGRLPKQREQSLQRCDKLGVYGGPGQIQGGFPPAQHPWPGRKDPACWAFCPSHSEHRGSPGFPVRTRAGGPSEFFSLPF